MTAPTDPPTENGAFVDALRSGLIHGLWGHSLVPGAVACVLRARAWVGWADAPGAAHGFDDSAFVPFLVTPAPGGVGTTPDEVRHYLLPGTREREEFEREVAASLGVEPLAVPEAPLSTDPRQATEQIRGAFKGSDLTRLARLVAEAAGFVLADPPAAEGGGA